MDTITIINKTEDYREWCTRKTIDRWGTTKVVSRGKVYDVIELDGLIALKNEIPVGLLTYQVYTKECEIVTVDSFEEHVGVGRALMSDLKSKIIKSGIYNRIWLITTNDNIRAIKFYQQCGYTISNVYKNSIEKARELKPSIPLTGNFGIPVRDEIEFELVLP